MTTFKFGPGDNLNVPVTTDNDTYIVLGGGQFNFVDLGTHTGDTVILGGGDNDDVLDHGLISGPSNNTIILGNGSHDSVLLFFGGSNFGASGDHVTVGNGDFDTLNVDPEPPPAGTNNNIITFGNGHDDVLISLGSGNIVTVGNGNHDQVSFVEDGDNNKVTVGSGDNDGVGFFGDNNVLTLGSGNNDIVALGGADALALGNNTVVLGNGNNDIVFSVGGTVGNTIVVGNGNDTIHVGHNDTVKVGTGQDIFAFHQGGPFTGPFDQGKPGGIGNVAIAGFDPSKDVIQMRFRKALGSSAGPNSTLNTAGSPVIQSERRPTTPLTW